MSERFQERLAIAVGAVILTGLFLFLPSLHAKIYASPDETAAATVVGELVTQSRTFLYEPLVRTIPWLHPRSWVSVGERVVPVGFLAWPWFLHWSALFFGQAILPIVASLLILSGVIPWYLLLRRRWGWRWAMVGSALVFFFPTVLFYGNRSLFANAPQLMCVFWVAWLLEAAPIFRRPAVTSLIRVVTGALIALAAFIRPVELAWMLPWFVWWVSQYPPRRTDLRWMGLGALLITLPLLWLARQTYGSWFGIGYFFHDNPSLLSVGTSSTLMAPTTHAAPSIWQLVLPYGFHPHNIWWNVVHFISLFLWPWTLALLGLLAFTFRKRENLRVFTSRSVWIPVVLAGWTLVFLLVLYGSGLYADHVRPGAVTIGNSFLRYLLPMVPVWSISVIWLVRQAKLIAWQRVICLGVLVVLMGSGIYLAFAKDDEGLLTTRRELVRYTQIRALTPSILLDRAIVLSERSDKIFFPGVRSVSPLPSIESVRLALNATSAPFYLYVRPLSGTQREAWRAQGIDVTEIQTFGREKLYRLSLFQR